MPLVLPTCLELAPLAADLARLSEVIAYIDGAPRKHLDAFFRKIFIAVSQVVDRGERTGVTAKMAEKMKALECENRELKQANEILRKASAYFAQVELDRRSRT